MRTARSTQRTLAATALLGMLLVGGCGTADSGDDGGGDGTTAAEGNSAARDGLADGPGAMDPAPADDVAGPLETAGELGFEAESAPKANDLREVGAPAVISNAVVSVHADDVGKARFDALKVMDRYGGTLQADETSSGDDGELETARLVMRIPSKDYARAKTELEKVASFVQSRSGSEDVTTEVIDVAARIRAQEQSLSRVEALLVQARNLRQVIAIESQLARRQADLDSLKSRQAWLRDQTSEATITMHIEQTPEEKAEKEDEDDKGFLAGLSSGWDHLVATTVGIATVVGLLLPFALVLALIVVPTLALVRRMRPGLTREPAAEPTD